ncbi:MAG: hypothetical protein EWV83_15900 [Microcystis sp. M_OC_Ca_00000000_S217Cul]|uniref:DUF6603 domain-containing protein n=1 Tax=unclassified Microcystis TaxID=2643300 RepID=UPI00118F7AE2|nr:MULTISPECIES: DUF6603 domain-containing protein [unclassified Microcystis]TRT74259.1 MAG: hypothetical protein EWV83_15900 [Microcystis sp. M_OC_Ca_00000000_S217Cul]TRT85970.1 MAG: hypothetical protein EWV66_17130 [Microcystis sp. M_OC_Ca_00000000_C217Col]
MTTNTEPKLKEELEKGLSTTSDDSPAKGPKITISIGKDIEFISEVKPDEKPSTGKTIVAYTAYKEEKEEPFSITLNDLMATLDERIADLLPKGLKDKSINFKNVMVIYRKEEKTSKGEWLFVLDLDIATKIKLKSLPVVGDLISDEVGKEELVPSLRLVVASKAFTIKEIRVLNDKIPDKDDEEEEEEKEKLIPPLPVPKKEGEEEGTKISVRKGLSLSGKLGLPDAAKILSLSMSPQEEEEEKQELAPGGKEEEGDVTNSKLAVWFDIDKTFGPFSLKQIGFRYDEEEDETAKIAILIDAAIKISGLTLSCDDLGVKIALDDLKPSLTISGLGIEYKNSTVEISGALLRSEKEKYTEYLGLASIKFNLAGKSFGVSAIGAYAYYDGKPSLFLYAVLHVTIVVDPSFIITGFALGFGYNRDLKVPSIDKLLKFPLVAEAVEPSDSKFSDDSELITKKLGQMDEYMPISIGSGFVAIGLKFTCFKMLDCFALLTVAIGEDFEINLLGIAKMKIPTPAKDSKNTSCILNMTMLLRARFSLSEGVISIEGQLASDCYLLSPDCRLTGGFAVCLWVSGPHAGDFVITLGGYHPLFKKPAHYPTVPRLGFHWKVGNCLSLKGEKYFALCAHAIMAGGRLEANFKLGKLWANFVAEAHFLISWKPYYYEILVQVRIQAGYGILGPVSLGVQLHIWGPEFAGTATFRIIFVKVTVEFGDQSSRLPEPIDWESFQSSFLPPAKSTAQGSSTAADVCSVVVNQGVTKQLSPATTKEVAFVVNPKELELVVNSAIPSKKASYQKNTQDTEPLRFKGKKAKTNFGVRSMGIKKDQLDSSYNIKITRKTKAGNSQLVDQNQFRFISITQDVPTALWGDAKVKVVKVKGQDSERILLPEANDQQFVEDVLSGFRIVPQIKEDVCSTNIIDVEKLQHDTTAINEVYAWQKTTAFSGVSTDNEARTTAIKNNIVSANTQNKRNNLLESLGFNLADDVKLTDSVANSFVTAPQVKA